MAGADLSLIDVDKVKRSLSGEPDDVPREELNQYERDLYDRGWRFIKTNVGRFKINQDKTVTRVE